MRVSESGVAVLVVLVVLAVTSASVSATPSPSNSSVSWHALLCSDTQVLACPAGDGSDLIVYVKDELDAPVVGASVLVDFASDCELCVCPWTEALTDANGHALIPIRAGIDRSLDHDCCQVTVSVTCEGITIPWSDGGSSNQMPWLSPDLNADCLVDQTDLDLHWLYLNSSYCAFNFNCDALVNIFDYLIVGQHLDHGCPATPVEQTSWGVIKSLYRP